MTKASDDILGRREKEEPEAQTGRKGGGQAGGGAYPNPHTGKSDQGGGGTEGFMGHGGQTEMPYHGGGQLGEQEVGGNENAPAGKTKPGEKDDHSPG
jgi:hypothetical protein